MAYQKNHRTAITESLTKIQRSTPSLNRENIQDLLLTRKFLILEGPPGTGKTRMAHLLAQDLNAKTFFTQFHAETSYSDFIWGMRPNLKSQQLIYEEVEGPLVKAICYAQNHPDENVILIIDEINRANLSNVLGQAFYLFEYQRDKSDLEIEITPSLKIKELPHNLYVIATMNTADRSLAVVDFALRRRFAWINLKPQAIDPLHEKDKKKLEKNDPNLTSYLISNDENEPKYFFIKYFQELAKIFKWHANAQEMNLQPGQAYFIAQDEEEMKKRIEYELLPLIREYIEEGLLLSAQDEFNDYFYSRIQKPLFE